MKAILELIPYYTYDRTYFPPELTIVVGVNCRYWCKYNGKLEERFAVMEEIDGDVTLSEIINASIKIWCDKPALVVRTKKGYHVYSKLFTYNYFETILLSRRFQREFPLAFQDINRSYYAWWNYFNNLEKKNFIRYLLRVSPTKYDEPDFKVIYYDAPKDLCHRAFIDKIKKLYEIGEMYEQHGYRDDIR